MEFLQTTAFMALLVVIQVLFVIGGVFLVGFLNKLNKKTQLNIDDATMDQIKEIVDDIVAATNQKTVSVLKEKSPTGKLTEKEKIKIFNEVKEAITACLDQTQINKIIETYSGLDVGLSVLIEKAVAYNHESVVPSGESTE